MTIRRDSVQPNVFEYLTGLGYPPREAQNILHRRGLFGPRSEDHLSLVHAQRVEPSDLPLTIDHLGSEVIGPIGLGYARWVRRHMANLRHPAAFALMRDGHLLGRTLNAVYDIPAGELWLGRAWCLFASMRCATDAEGWLNLLVRSRVQPITCEAAATALQLGDTKAFGDSPDRRVSPNHVTQLVRTIRRRAGLRNHLTRKIARQRRTVLSHLRAAGWGSRNPLILIDVGYSGTIQRCLRNIFDIEGLQTPIEGFYLGTSCGAVWASSRRSRLRGFRFSFGSPAPEFEAFLSARFDLELALSKPSGPLRELTADGRAELDPVPYAAHQVAVLERLQLDALCWATDHANLPDDAVRHLSNVAFARLLRGPTPLSTLSYDDEHSGVRRN